MYKYCPHCGKPFLEPDKPRTVGLVSQVKEFITWAQIKEWSDLREASKHFEIGDEGEAASYWWERSPYASSATYFCCVGSNGDAYYYYASSSYGVAFGFCV